MTLLGFNKIKDVSNKIENASQWSKQRLAITGEFREVAVTVFYSNIIKHRHNMIWDNREVQIIGDKRREKRDKICYEYCRTV